MQFAPVPNGEASPETLVARLLKHLRSQRIWDALLNFVPPATAAIYLLVQLYRAAWLPQSAFVVLTILVIGSGALGVALSSGRRFPSVRLAARLADDKAAAEDRFLTLATVEPSSCSQPLLARLRAETRGFADRVDPRRDFRYKIKGSFYRSLIGSVLALVLFHFLVPLVESTMARVAPPQQISELAEKVRQRSDLAGLARELDSLASKLQDPNLPLVEKQQLIQRMQKQVAEAQKNPQQTDDQDLLSEAASTLKGLERQSGSSQEKEQDKGGGSVQSTLPQEAQGGKQSQGGAGGGKGDMDGQQSRELEQGKSAKADPKEQGDEKNQRDQGSQANQIDKDRPGKDQREMAGKTEGGLEEQLGKSKSEGKGRSEENPQGPPPAERFTKPGEEGPALKGRRYVTVQLPEELAAEGNAESSAGKERKAGKPRSNLPISNVPLPAHVPDAPAEKQNLPLEYRGIIR
jgi:hypothetical protein